MLSEARTGITVYSSIGISHAPWNSGAMHEAQRWLAHLKSKRTFSERPGNRRKGLELRVFPKVCIVYACFDSQCIVLLAVLPDVRSIKHTRMF